MTSSSRRSRLARPERTTRFRADALGQVEELPTADFGRRLDLGLERIRLFGAVDPASAGFVEPAERPLANDGRLLEVDGDGNVDHRGRSSTSRPGASGRCRSAASTIPCAAIVTGAFGGEVRTVISCWMSACARMPSRASDWSTVRSPFMISFALAAHKRLVLGEVVAHGVAEERAFWDRSAPAAAGRAAARAELVPDRALDDRRARHAPRGKPTMTAPGCGGVIGFIFLRVTLSSDSHQTTATAGKVAPHQVEIQAPVRRHGQPGEDRAGPPPAALAKFEARPVSYSTRTSPTVRALIAPS